MRTVICGVLGPRLRTLEDVRQNLSGPSRLGCSQPRWVASLLKEHVHQWVGPKCSCLSVDLARGGCFVDSVRCHQGSRNKRVHPPCEMSAWQTRDSLPGTEGLSDFPRLCLPCSALYHPSPQWTGETDPPWPSPRPPGAGNGWVLVRWTWGLGRRSHWPLSDPDVSAECWAGGPVTPAWKVGQKCSLFLITLRTDGKCMAEWAE